MRRLAPALCCVLVLAPAAACGPSIHGGGDDDGTGVDAPGNLGDGGDMVADRCKKMDIIFVVDNSGSMSEEQSNLGTNFPQFANLLNSYTIPTGETLDYHAAITTTGITANYVVAVPGFPTQIPMSQSGDDGKFRQGCGMTRPWFERTDPNMASEFACDANVGTSGPGLEMPLRAAELAIKPATNPGFLRDDALLGMVFLTDEDDCSRRMDGFTTAGDGCATNGDVVPAVSEFIDVFDQAKGDRGRWAAAVIAGQTSCSSSFGMADEAIRLKQFQQQAGQNVVFGDICAGNLTSALQQAMMTFQAACDNFPPIGRQLPE